MLANRYVPIEGGWRVRMSKGKPVSGGGGRSGEIGVCVDDPRGHRRPLYPVADRGVFEGKGLVEEEVERLSMRAVVVAYHWPRFEFDFHHGGGVMGDLRVGLEIQGGETRWLEDWSDVEVSYVFGRMEYVFSDAGVAGVRVKLTAVALADALGAGFEWEVSGVGAGGARVVFCFKASKGEKTRMSAGVGGFELRRRFDPPVKGGTNLSKKFYPTGWEAVVVSRWTAIEGESRGGGERETQGETTGGEEAVLRTVDMKGRLVIGMGDGMEGEPGGMFERGVKRGEEIGGRVKVTSPDAHLNAAVTTMAYTLEGMWGGLAYLHGAWTWRFAYLGWRTWYGPDCYGWMDRVRTAIKNHIRLSLFKEGPDRGGIGSIIEFEVPMVYYNMNEVFFDMVRHYFDHTNDVALMGEVWPVLEGIIQWENRRLRPTEEPLYENSLNTWISDSHWMIGGHGTQASAYMLGAHAFMARLAGFLGREAGVWEKAAAGIGEAMQRRLWQVRQGVFAEGQDTRGNKLVHAEPELPTLYHAAEFGAADAMQIYQMLEWGAGHLPREETAGGGRQYWSSNWRPNHGRSYTHSTYELAYAENLNYALTHYLVGRRDEGWALIKGALCGVFNGPTAGGLSCHAGADGRQRRNEEFADAASMWARAVVEGLFGVVVKRPEGWVELRPGLPTGWNEAGIQTPNFSYTWKREEGREELYWTSPVVTRVRLRLPVKAGRIAACSGAYTQEAGVGLTWVVMESGEGVSGRFEVRYEAMAGGDEGERAVKVGEAVEIGEGGEVLDPQGLLKGGVVVGSPGPGVVFERRQAVGQGACPVIRAHRVRVEGPGRGREGDWVSPGFTERGLGCWGLVDLSGVFNAQVMEVVGRVVEGMRPPEGEASGINFEYRGGHFTKLMGWGGKPGMSDAGWRAKVAGDGVAWTQEGIPFKTAGVGNNIAVVTLEGGFPGRVRVPVGQGGRRLYLMLSGVTWPMQSHVVNLRVTLAYADGARVGHDLANPMDIGDCWDTWLGSFHDCARCGFENIGGRFGPAGSRGLDLTLPVEVDTEANLLAFELREGQVVEALELEAVANDVVFGVMGMSVWRG